MPYYTDSQNKVHTQWGFSIWHLIGSYFMCHPNYINNLIDLKIYDPVIIIRICHDLLANDQNKYFNKTHLHELLKLIDG